MKTGLYQPHQFKDNCGFGLIAQMEGKQSYDLLKTAIESLTSNKKNSVNVNVTHA